MVRTLIIEAISPAQKAFQDYYADRNERRASTSDMYSRDDNGSQRILIPTGNNTYDVLIAVNCKAISTETEGELMDLARAVPKTYIEQQAPHMVENEFFIFIADKFKTHFRRGYCKYLSYNHYRYFWFFSMKWGKDQIMYRIRIMLSRLWSARAAGIERSCKKKHFEPYGQVKAIVEAFRKGSAQLKKYSDGIIYASQLKPGETPPQSSPDEIFRQSSAVLLDLVSKALPKLYEPMRTLFSIEYPEFCGPPQVNKRA